MAAILSRDRWVNVFVPLPCQLWSHKELKRYAGVFCNLQIVVSARFWFISDDMTIELNSASLKIVAVLYDNYNTSEDITVLDTFPLQWRHNQCKSVSNHRRHDCLFNRLFRRRSKKTSKFRVAGICEGNSPVTDEYFAQRAIPVTRNMFPFDDVIMFSCGLIVLNHRYILALNEIKSHHCPTGCHLPFLLLRITENSWETVIH